MAHAILFSVLFLAMAVIVRGGEECRTVVGECIGGSCPNGATCFGSVCCNLAASSTADQSDLAAVGFCKKFAEYCNHTDTAYAMQYQCRATCSKQKPPVGSCKDKLDSHGVNECPQFKYRCNDPLWYDVMTDQCPKTCGRCPH